MTRKAIHQEQKEERRDGIIRSALTLLQDHPYHRITVQMIMKEAGLAKGTFFLYFKTKEELFIDVIADGYANWFAYMEAEMERLPGGGVEPFVEAIVHGYDREPQMVRLMRIMHTVLEENISFETAARLKLMLHEKLGKLAERMERHFSFFRGGEAARFLIQAHALAVGYRNMTDLSENVQRVIEEFKLDVFRIDFLDELKKGLTMLLLGHMNMRCE